MLVISSDPFGKRMQMYDNMYRLNNSLYEIEIAFGICVGGLIWLIGNCIHHSNHSFTRTIPLGIYTENKISFYTLPVYLPNIAMQQS